MRKTLGGLALAAALVSLTAPVRAVQYFSAALDSVQENQGGVPSTSPGQGYGTVALADDEQSLTYTLVLGGLTQPNSTAPDLFTLAHFHQAPPTASGPVVRDIFDWRNGAGKQDASVPFSFTFTGTWSATDAVQPLLPSHVAALKSGGLYFNAHTDMFARGAIRGNIVAGTSAIPEPGTFALLGTGLIPLAGVWRRRRR